MITGPPGFENVSVLKRLRRRFDELDTTGIDGAIPGNFYRRDRAGCDQDFR
jgi:hypothetical protein